MGFGCFVVLEVPKPLLLLLHLLNFISSAFVLVVDSINLLSFHLFTASSCPSPPSLVRSRLPVVEYGSFVKLHEPTCVVSLEELEERDEVRELGNCNHAFRRGCIDCWIDMGYSSCPLCRLQMLRREKGRIGNGLLQLLPKIW